MTCIDAREKFAELLADEMDPARTAELQTHLAGCPSCAAELALLEGAASDIGALALVPAPVGFTDAVMSKLGRGPSLSDRLREHWPVAVAAVAVTAIAAGLLLPARQHVAAGAVRPAVAAAASAPGPTAHETASHAQPGATSAATTALESPEETTSDPATARSVASNSQSTGFPASKARSQAPATPATSAAAAETPRSGSEAAPRSRASAAPVGGPRTEALDHGREARPAEPAENGTLD